MKKPPKSDNDNRDLLYEVFGIRSMPPDIDEKLLKAIRSFEKTSKFNERMKNPFFRKRAFRSLRQSESIALGRELTHEEMGERMKEHSKRIRARLEDRKLDEDKSE